MKSTILTHRAETLEALRKCLNDADIESEVSADSLSQLAAAGTTFRDLLIVETDGSRSDLGLIEKIASRSPSLAVILVAADPSKEFLLQAMGMGVREVLTLPLRPEVVKEVLHRSRQRFAPAPMRQGKILVFQPCKGGSGATFLGANLAYALAMEGKRVALLDFNLQFGDAALHVSDINGTTSIADVAQQMQRLDGDFLMSSMIRVLPNFGVLPSPDAPDRAMGVRPENVQRILDVARENFDYVVVDIERNFDPVSIRALDCADSIMTVLQLTLPFIRDAKRALAVYDSLGYSRSKVRPIVNRYQKGGDISLGDVESTLGIAVAYTIPNSFSNVANSVNQGTPILKLDPNDRVSKALMEMAHHMEQRSSTQAGGWLSRLFGKAA